MKKCNLIGKILGIALMLVVLGVILTSGAHAPENRILAQAPMTWYVDDDKLDCPGANFSTIHDAMDASSFGDIIIACTGNYHEIDAVIEAGRELVIEAGAVWRVRSLVLLEWAHWIHRGIFYWQAGYSVDLSAEGASISNEGGHGYRDYNPFLIVDEAQTDKGTYSAYESVQITGMVTDQNGTGVSANVTAEIQKPGGSIQTISLSETGPGSYEGTFTDTSIGGIYRVAIQAEKTGYTGHAAWLSFQVEGGTACIATATGTGIACFTTSNGTIEDLEALPAIPPGAPSGIMFPHGMFSFKITGLSFGQEVTLTVELPDPVPIGTKWWKYQDGLWYSLDIGDDDDDNIITVMLKDGDAGDADGSENGEIMDDGGSGNPGPLGWETYSVNKARVLLPWIILLTTIITGASFLVVRRRGIRQYRA